MTGGDAGSEGRVHQVVDQGEMVVQEILEQRLAVPGGALVIAHVGRAPHRGGPVQGRGPAQHPAAVEPVLLGELQEIGAVARNGEAVPVGSQFPAFRQIPDGFDPGTAVEGRAPGTRGPVHGDAVGVEVGHPLLEVVAGQTTEETVVTERRQPGGSPADALGIEFAGQLRRQAAEFCLLEGGMPAQLEGPEAGQGEGGNTIRQQAEGTAIEVVAAGELSQGSHEKGCSRWDRRLQGIHIGMPVPGRLGAVGESGDGEAMTQKVIELQPDQVVREVEVSGDPAGDLHVRAGIRPHRDQMGTDAEAEHRSENHSGIESPREGEEGGVSGPGLHRTVQRLHRLGCRGRPAGEFVEADAAVQPELAAGAVEVNKAARRNLVDVRMEAGVAG